MLMTPGRAPPRLAQISRRARPMVAWARVPGPRAPAAQLSSIVTRAGPLTMKMGATVDRDLLDRRAAIGGRDAGDELVGAAIGRRDHRVGQRAGGRHDGQAVGDAPRLELLDGGHGLGPVREGNAP